MNKWFTPADILSYGKLLNFVVGNRGGGKTFNTLAFCINAFLKKKDQFVYVRRTADELKVCKDKLFNDIIAHEIFPNTDLRVKGNEILIDNQIAGYCIPLSTNHHYRSVAMPKVKYIIYDEFLKRKDAANRYLKNEAEQFLELLETIARNRNNVRVFFLGNSMSKNNPFFDYFKIYPVRGANFTTHKDKDISVVIQQYVNHEQVKEKMQTEMGKTISGSQYGNYNMGNEYFEDDYTFVEPMSGKGMYQFTINFSGHSLGVYWQEQKGVFHINKNANMSYPVKFAFSTEDHSPNIILFKTAKQNPYIKRLIMAYDYGLVRFDNVKTANLMLDIIGYL